MSYQVLARKWRPRSFSTLVGQEHVVRALSHALQTGRLHHAWLFTGTRGVGKTTISRILAKALNCETGVTAEPCGECSACKAIDADRFPDYIEMDAASNRGVDDMAALLDQAMYAPVQGRYKVYMIDEVHMLTGHAFNAMLKTLEEPPEHVKFILATTDPQKIPVTVLSRCLQFNLKQMPQGHIVSHLSRILEAESLVFEEAALRHIAKAASGSMRDALSLLDQSIAHGAGRVEAAQVASMLGTVGDDHLYEVLDGLAAGDVNAMLAVADSMQARSLSFEAALQTLASLLHRLSIMHFAPSAIADATEREQLARYSQAFDAEFLQLAYQIAIHGRDELPLAPDEYAGFTMVLLRLHAFRPDSPSTIGPAPVSGGQGAGGGAVRHSMPGQLASRSEVIPPQASARPGGADALRSGPAPVVAQPVPAAGAISPSRSDGQSIPAASGLPQSVAASNGAERASGGRERAPEQPVSGTASKPAKPAAGDIPPWESLPDEALYSESAGAVPESHKPDTSSFDSSRQAVEPSPVRPVPKSPEMAGSGDPTPGRQSHGAPVSSGLSAQGERRNNLMSGPVADGLDAVSAPAPVLGAAISADSLQALMAAGDWHAVCQELELGGMLRELAQHCEWVERQGTQIELRLSQTHHHLLDLNASLPDRLSEQLSARLGESVKVRIRIGDILGETPAQRDEAIRQARHAHAVEALEGDPLVRLLIDRFDATLIEASVKPL